MRKYYLFIIKTEYYKLYKKDPHILYQTLYQLYCLKEPNFAYGISIFDSICQPFSVKLLRNYIQNKYTCSMKSQKVMHLHSPEDTLLQINYACIIVKSNFNFPDVLRVFHIYNKKILVCDFENEDYFWLSMQMQKRKSTFAS